MLALLKFSSDGNEHSAKEAIESLSHHFKLTNEEKTNYILLTRFQQWRQSGLFDKLWTRLLKIYHNKRGIKWNWQSLDSISVKSPLGGR